MTQTTSNLSLIMLTSNQNKIREINEILTDLPIPIKSYTDIVDTLPEITEDGTTFTENALKKVSVAFHSERHIYFAEDSGIEVSALDGRPGVFSARYAGENATRETMCTKLLKELGNHSNRKAQFQAAIAIRFPDNTTKTVSGIIKGTISQTIQGEKGFGYDPIFIPHGYNKTFGDLPKEIKNTLSHRYKAIQKMKEEITKYLASNT